MHAITSGAIDQNMSRPSCRILGFCGLGAGAAWPVTFGLGCGFLLT